MVDFSMVAIADVLKHPVLGLISHQPGLHEAVQDRIHVRDLKFTLHEVLASECEWATPEEKMFYWRTVNEHPNFNL